MTGTTGSEDKMTFYTFMMRNHRGNDTPAGDLAGDIYSDKDSFPRNCKGKFEGWHRILRDHLESRHASTECLDVFEGCWKEYVACERSRSNRNW